MGSRSAVDPDGVSWSVHRRWYPWRRNLSLRELWAYTQTDTAEEPESAPTDDDQPEESTLPRNVVAKAFLVVLAATVWVVYQVGKVLFYTAVVVVFLVISLIELALEIVAMPIALVLRLIGAVKWPVEIVRQGKHFGTREAKYYGAAGDLRDGLVTQIQRGGLAPDQQPSAA